MCVFTYISLLFIHLHFPLLVEELPHCHLTLDPSRRHDRDAADARSQLDAQRVEEVEDCCLDSLQHKVGSDRTNTDFKKKETF